MNVQLTDSARAELRRWQKQRRDNEGYVKVTVLEIIKKCGAVGLGGHRHRFRR